MELNLAIACAIGLAGGVLLAAQALRGHRKQSGMLPHEPAPFVMPPAEVPASELDATAWFNPTIRLDDEELARLRIEDGYAGPDEMTVRIPCPEPKHEGIHSGRPAEE